MKNLFKYTMGVLMAGVLVTACSPESFDGADPNGIPSVSGVDFNISVDQETNQMIATYTPQAGTYPVWILNGNTYSTLQEVGYQNPEAGTYTIDLKLEALACHKSQIDWMRDHDHIDFLDFVRCCSRVRGFQSGVEYAEGFRPCLNYLRMSARRLLP